MRDRTLQTIGIIGTFVAALFCFTPVLAVLFGVAGVSILGGWLDYVLMPALGIFLTITGHALIRRSVR